MPIYEYHCKSHGTWEEIQAEFLESMACPACGEQAKRLASRFACRMAPTHGELMSYLADPNADAKDSGVTVNDSDSFWEGWSDGVREAFDRPNPLYFQSDKPFVDMGK